MTYFVTDPYNALRKFSPEKYSRQQQHAKLIDFLK